MSQRNPFFSLACSRKNSWIMQGCSLVLGRGCRVPGAGSGREGKKRWLRSRSLQSKEKLLCSCVIGGGRSRELGV